MCLCVRRSEQEIAKTREGEREREHRVRARAVPSFAAVSRVRFDGIAHRVRTPKCFAAFFFVSYASSHFSFPCLSFCFRLSMLNVLNVFQLKIVLGSRFLELLIPKPRIAHIATNCFFFVLFSFFLFLFCGLISSSSVSWQGLLGLGLCQLECEFCKGAILFPI